MLNLDRPKNDSSVTLDLLRAVAAQMVCVGHAITFFIGGIGAASDALAESHLTFGHLNIQ